MSDVTVHYTSHEALKHGVRKCIVIADRGRNLTVAAQG